MEDLNDYIQICNQYSGNGYATETVIAMTNYIERTFGIKEIVGRHAKENTASEHVMKKLGFRYEKDIPYECNNGAVLMEGKMHRLYLKFMIHKV